MQVKLLLWCSLFALFATIIPIGIISVIRLYNKRRMTNGPWTCICRRQRTQQKLSKPLDREQLLVYEAFPLEQDEVGDDGDDICMDDVTICESRPVERAHATICWIKGRPVPDSL